MSKYEALFEDENDIFNGTPKSTYWGFASKISQDFLEDEFDKVVQKIAVMENLLSEHYDIDKLDKLIEFHYDGNKTKIEELKKSVYLELGGNLISKVPE